MINKVKGLFIGLLVFAAPAWAAEDSARFTEIYEQEWAFRLAEFPLLASDIGVDDYNDRLGHVSEPHQARRHEYWLGVREKLRHISCDRLSPDECIDFRIFNKQIDDFIAAYETKSYLIPFNSDWGFYLSWARLPAETDFVEARDYRDYLSRIAMLPDIMDEYIALMRRGIEIGFTQPQVVLEGREAPIRAQLVERAELSPFFEPFKSMPESMPNGDRAELLRQAREAVMDGVVPAYRRLHDFLTREYLPAARDSLGAYRLPGGEAFYRAQIRYFATVDWSPERIHQIGLQEVERITLEMQEILEELEFEGSLAEFIAELRADPQFYAQTPRELLAAASYYAKKVDGRLPMLFGHLPRQPYGVAPVPDDLAPFYTAGRYVPAPIESRRGGYYWVNTHDLRSRPLYALPALTLHEAAPGHHTQNALAREQGDQPPFRRYDYISAYGEGWALYAEKLGVEMDIYETPYEHFGRLTYEMWRACRLVIDTGLHAFDWTREQAQDYLAQRTALSIHEITTEVDRYISWPAQALSYKLGEYTIWQLRREAERELGEAFDIRGFHDFVLGLGSVPLDVLSDEVRRWMKEQAQGGRN